MASATHIESNNVSHYQEEISFEASLKKIQDKILKRGDLPYVSMSKQLELLDLLKASSIGRFLIERGGLNGYWTYNVVKHPTIHPKPTMNSIEEFLFNQSPTCLATQERFQIFKRELQKRVTDGVVLASVPCGLMGDLIELEFSNVSEFRLIGIDLDFDALTQAKQLGEEANKSSHCEFIHKDAWTLDIVDQFDVLTSNGLSIYEPQDARVIELYRQFYQAIKPGGCLIASFLTPPPIPGQESEWNMAQVNPADALLQKIIFTDILNCKWQIFRSSQVVKAQLETAGFEELEFHNDKASIFPTVVAKKPKV